MIFSFLEFPNAEAILLSNHKEGVVKTSMLQKIRKVLVPPRHGEFGNVITEIYCFSRFRWFRLFRNAGWIIENYYLNKLFYTGYGILDLKLDISTRHFLSYILGSSCHIFVLRKK